MIKEYLRLNYLLVLLLVAIFFKGAVTSLLVPLWEFPDEQAHFAQIAYYVETGTEFQGNDLSREIYFSQLAMGTARDDRGINQHTYRAHFRPAYTDSLVGIYEPEILSLESQARTDYVKREAARYPPLYYQLNSVGYRMAYDADLINRVYAVRWVNILLALISTIVAYAVGIRLFGNKIYAILLTTVISFQPMFSFVSAGINNDNLLNLLSLLVLWLVLDIFDRGLKWSNSLSLGLVAGLGVLTKPLMIPVLLPVPFFLLWEWYRSGRSWRKQLWILLPAFVVSVVSGGYLILRPLVLDGRLPYITSFKADSPLHQLSFLDYMSSQLGLYYRETLVWYWGVFKWLSVILPLDIVRVIKVVMGLAGMGLVRHVIRSRQDKFISITGFHKVLLLIIWSLVYIAAITLWDYDMVRKNGFSHGLQGRYFFPTLGAHMGLFMIGTLGLVKVGWRKWAGLSLALFIIGVHLASLWTIASVYYDLDTVRSFFTQLSQYEPWYFKYPFALVWLALFWLALFTLIMNLIKVIYNSDEKIPTKVIG